MQRSILFQYAVIWHPTEAEAKEGDKSKVVVQVTEELAPHMDAIKMIAARSIPDIYMDQLDQIEIAVRPF